MSTPSVLLVEEGGVGGVADYTGELAGALAAAGWAVTLATAHDHRYSPSPGVRVVGVFSYVRGGRRLGRMVRRARLSKPVNGVAHLAASVPLVRLARQADVIHMQGGEWPPLTLLHALLIRVCRRRLVWTPHNTFERGRHGYRRTRALTVLCTDGIVLHAEYDRRALSPRASARAVVIPHGEYGTLGSCAAEPAADPRPGTLADDGEIVVLLFGQLRPDKGIRDLLQATIEVEGIRVWLVGEEKGGLADAGELLSDGRLRDRVVVREGFISMPEARAVFADADVVALPYHQVSASGVLMLAYGYGRPVVAYPTGGLPEYVIAGETGWLCAGSEPRALAAALAEIRACGRQVCRERGAAARRLSEERYSWSAVASETARLYADVLDRRSGSGERS